MAIASLESVEAAGSGPGGIRLGNFLQIRGELGNGLQEIFANKVTVQQGLDEAVDARRCDPSPLRATYKGKELP